MFPRSQIKGSYEYILYILLEYLIHILSFRVKSGGQRKKKNKKEKTAIKKYVYIHSYIHICGGKIAALYTWQGGNLAVLYYIYVCGGNHEDQLMVAHKYGLWASKILFVGKKENSG